MQAALFKRRRGRPSQPRDHLVAETATCTRCGEPKPADEFALCRRNSSGLDSWCRQCRRTYQQRPDVVQRYRSRDVARRRTLAWKFKHLRHIARARRLEVTLSFTEYVQLNARPCDYCGGSLPPAGMGLDRLDNVQGYTVTNVVPCCANCNSIRGDVLTPAEMRLVAALLRAVRAGAGFSAPAAYTPAH